MRAARQCARPRVIERGLRQRGRLLGDVSDGPAGRHVQIALVLMQLIAQQREEAGLAAAIGTGQADAPTGMNLQAGVFKQGCGATGEAQIAKLDHVERMQGEAKTVFYRSWTLRSRPDRPDRVRNPHLTDP